jgi:hypothetical protein
MLMKRNCIALESLNHEESRAALWALCREFFDDMGFTTSFQQY